MSFEFFATCSSNSKRRNLLRLSKGLFQGFQFLVRPGRGAFVMFSPNAGDGVFVYKCSFFAPGIAQISKQVCQTVFPFDPEGLGGGHVSCLVGLPLDGAH